MIDASSPFASSYDLANIIGLYQKRNCKFMSPILRKTKRYNSEKPENIIINNICRCIIKVIQSIFLNAFAEEESYYSQ